MARQQRLARILLGTTTALITAFPDTSSAETWEVTPSIAVEEKWTDNVLSTPRDRKSDYLTTVTPTINVVGKGPRANLGLNYSMSYDRYAAYDDLDGMRHQGLAVAESDLVEDLFSVDARGAISEKLLNPTGTATAGDRSSVDNRARVASYSVAPMLRHRFGTFAAAQARYRHDETKYLTAGSGRNTTPSVNDSVGDSGKLGVRSGDQFTRLLWSYELENLRRDAGTVFIQTSHIARAEYKLNREWGILAHGGHDYLNGAALESDQYSGAFYGGGVHWTPSPRTDVSAEVGRRYNDLNIFVKGTQAIGARTQVNLSHQTGVTTEAETIATALGEVERDPLGRLIDPFTGLEADPTASPFQRSDSAFKQTVTSLAASHKRERDTFHLIGSLSTRENPRTGTTGSTDTTALDLSAVWTHRLTELVTGTATIGRSDIVDAPTAAGKMQRLRGTLGLTWMMSPNLSSNARYWYVDTQPESGDGVTENMVGIGLNATF